MAFTDFFRSILPQGTRYALRLIHKPTDKRRNVFSSSFEEMGQQAEELSRSGLDLYYATAGFGAQQKANAENAVAKRELYIDIDCGEGKPYQDKAEGLNALRQFCTTVGLPKPTLIDSGNGIHVHWFFNDSVALHEWHAVAEALKNRCITEGFKVDGGCTADYVRVLRIPGTINTKNGATVTLLTPIKHHDFSALRDIIGVSVSEADMFAKARALSKGSTEETKKLFVDPNKTNKFHTIWMKSVGGFGCSQINYAIRNQETLSEPMWRGVLSIAQHCEDRDWGIHEISKDHPNYSPEETEAKAALTKGPYTCETFRGLDEGALCEKCPHYGKITSPIQLGSEIKASTEPVKVKVEDREETLPSYPFPFFRGATGGVYMRIMHPEGDKALHVSAYDIYIYKRMRDGTGGGDTLWVRHHLPHNDVREFTIQQSEVASKDKFRDCINREGVIAFEDRQIGGLQLLFSKMIEELQRAEKADNMKIKFGWTPDNTFVIGNREYTRNGVVHSPTSKPLENYVNWFTPKGDIEEWKSVIALYNTPDMDLHAAGVLAGFGSVLMNLSPENGGVLNYYSKKSGTGKTTILRIASSIFGDPLNLMKDAQDTKLTKVHRMGLMNGIVVTIDEMTNADPMELSDLLYNSTQGRARDRMQSNSNAERTNNTRWKQITLWSSNAAVEDRLISIKSDPQGELARVLEIRLDTPVPSDVLGAQLMFNKILDNYGHAGDIYMRYVIPHLDEVKRIWENTRDKIYSMERWTQTERYKLNVVICMVAAGLITNNLGLTQFNIARIAKKLVGRVRDLRDELKTTATTASSTVSSFINKNIRNILIVNKRSGSSGIPEVPRVEPQGELIIRYEPDTDALFINKREFTKWCSSNFINAREIGTLFSQETGGVVNVTKKRMGAGWRTDLGAVDVLEFPNARSLLNLDDLDGSSAPA